MCLLLSSSSYGSRDTCIDKYFLYDSSKISIEALFDRLTSDQLGTVAQLFHKKQVRNTLIETLRQMLGNECHCYDDKTLYRRLHSYLSTKGKIAVSAHRGKRDSPDHATDSYDSDTELPPVPPRHLKVYILGGENYRTFDEARCTLSLWEYAEFDSVVIDKVQYDKSEKVRIFRDPKDKTSWVILRFPD